MTKGSIASLVLTQYFDFLENSLSCGTFGLLSEGTMERDPMDARARDPKPLVQGTPGASVAFAFVFNVVEVTIAIAITSNTRFCFCFLS